ncbi:MULTISPECIES: AAA family ATPase [unclassified Streptomyces]|uniref:AAA family ATPase n=1 Tax=unclassified Streptomyces TaxID=2593676 RepID=UPI00225841F4|nr:MULTISPECIES: AAA family ATPase [unclassified Streptomyces]MCX4866511.1 AAA family ATPase [Streptomyces sp. NBC_00906]MCX4897749.1 AAA family ATPase [Streptomyces sp. NBC_00892]
MSETHQSVKLPVIHALELSHFTLYQNRNKISIDFGDGVFCLAGANGLGKSTFLAILNYAITGIVASPNQKFQSAKEYYEDSLKYAPGYFQGRVNELYRGDAEVTVRFTVGTTHYTITRDFFTSQSLRRMEIDSPSGKRKWTVQDADVDGNQIHNEYVSAVLTDTGLAGFEQLVFLQHFLVTFDERRHLLFWDSPDATLYALYLVFGVDPTKVADAAEWARMAERLESQARNAQYQATTARDNRNEVLKRSGPDTLPNMELLDQHESLVAQQLKAQKLLEAKAAEVEDARLRVSVLAAEASSLRLDYNKSFELRFTSKNHPEHNPLIAQLLDSCECSVCGQTGEEVTHATKAALEANNCPLCRLELPAPVDQSDETFAHLEDLDRKLATSKEQLASAQATSERLHSELSSVRSGLVEITDTLRAFEQENSEELAHAKLPSDSDTITKILQQYDDERREATRRRDDFRTRREEYRRRLAPIQKELARKYHAAELDFVPTFQRLAYQFLGLDLEVQMYERVRGPELVVTINGTRRRETTQLSESQQYFVDIALRMALVQYLVGDEGVGGMFIDTPEGSLDIAYEKRAGQMFGQFVTHGNRLVMTANINSSQLVVRLAEECGSARMHVERMTSWTTLSEVQAESEALFDEAYMRIEQALERGIA